MVSRDPDRLAAALRENLRRRKGQARARAEEARTEEGRPEDGRAEEKPPPSPADGDKSGPEARPALPDAGAID
ncbi:MAG: hypothetical protein IT561_10050 [Alphaproteobacteria bacterium]|nr:hypothetical protein [Alphaproteobacteria bacterium]